MFSNSLLETDAKSDVQVTAISLEPTIILVRKRTLNQLTKVTKWLSWDVSTYLYNAFYCMFLSFHGQISV